MARAQDALERPNLHRLEYLGNDLLQSRLILRVEARELRAVEIQYAEQLVPAHHWHYDFRVGRAVAGDVAVELVYVLHDHACAACSRRAAHSLAERDPHARWLALERADHQLAALEQIEAHPVQVWQRVIDERGDIREVRDQAALSFHQRTGLRDDARVELRIRQVRIDMSR